MKGFLEGEFFSGSPKMVVEDEFAEGKECSQSHERAYLAKQNLCRRLGEDEDKDLEILISSMENIAKLLSMKMYEYGKNEQRMELVC